MITKMEEPKQLMANSILSVGPLAMIFGPITLALAFWSQIKGFLQRFSSVFIVTVDVNREASEILLAYLWKNFKFQKIGRRRFNSTEAYVRPKDSYEWIAYEAKGVSLTFLSGIRPIFISGAENSDNIVVTYVRGMFDIEQLLVAALEDMNQNSKHKKNKRFFTRKIFGSRNRNLRDRDNREAPLKEGSSSGYLPTGAKILKWTREDIGTPLNDNPFSHLAYSDEVSALLEHLKQWLKSKEWYAYKGLDWRCGALLHGPAGTGKTSFARAVGQFLDMPIFIFDLNSMINEEVVEHWREALASSPCIVLFEDFDRIFDKDKNLKTGNDSGALTLDCLLNCINGVEPSNGIVTLVTANDISKLDTAIGVPDEKGESTRPGRLDRTVYFGLLEEKALRQIAGRILSDVPEDVREEQIQKGIGTTGAQFTKRCELLALHYKWRGVVPEKI